MVNYSRFLRVIDGYEYLLLMNAGYLGLFECYQGKSQKRKVANLRVHEGRNERFFNPLKCNNDTNSMNFYYTNDEFV